MRYLYNKTDDNDDIKNLAKEYVMKPLNTNGVLPVNDAVSGSAYPMNGQFQPQKYYNPNAQMEQLMRQADYTLNNQWSPDSYKLIYEVKTERGFFGFIADTQEWMFFERKQTHRKQNNLHGGIAYTEKIKDNGIAVCDSIWFVKVDKFQREDKPGKHFYNVFSSVNGYNDFLLENKVVEIKDVNGSRFSLILNGEIVKPGQETLCSIFFRFEVNRLGKLNVEITIPSHPGWYRDDKYDWVYLSRDRYMNLKDHEIPEGMNRRTVGRTDRSVNTVYSDLKSLIENNWQNMLLLVLRLVSSLLIMMEKQRIMPRQIIAPIVANQEQCSIATAILKTSDLFSLNIISLDQYMGDISKEILESRDGIAVISGPQTAAEAKINGKQSRIVRNAAIGANGTDQQTRCLIAMIGRFLPVDISPEHVFPIDCSGLSANIDLKTLRSLVLEFDAAFIQYIEENFDKVEGIISDFVSNYKEYPDSGIIREREDLYIMLMAVCKVMKECFSIEIFDDDILSHVIRLFTEVSTDATTPDETVRDEFVDVTNELIMNGEFSFMDVNKAHRQFNKGENILIVDKKKGFLSFEMSSLNKIAERMNSVKNGAELAAALKQCGAMKCCDNGGRQITTPMGRTEFYSVYLSEFGDEIMNVISCSENFKFFILPEETPEGFIPLVWYKGRCAGIVLGGEGLPNFHVDISGMSGLGKNRGAFRIAESCLKLGTKIIFIDVKGGCSDNQLINMDCDLHQYQRLDLKTKGLPFNIFDVKAFSGKNAKAGYIMNIFTAAVKLTSNQADELSSYVYDIIDDNTNTFSLDDLKAKLPNNMQTALMKKLLPFYNLMASYKPDKEDYQYNSCREFLDSNDRITILSLAQASTPEIRCIVYALMSSIYAHQMCVSSIPLILAADEMQHYDADSPFRQWVSEGRQYGISVWGITQEYLSKDNDTRKFMSNAAFNIFYGATTDSSKRVTEALNNRYTREEVETKGMGDVIAKGYFWNPIEKRHMPVILEGRNDNN